MKKLFYTNEKINAAENIREWVLCIVAALLLALFIRTFIFQTARVDGSSMYPTFEHGDLLIVKKYDNFINPKKYSRGDIIIFSPPTKEKKKRYIKRIIGLPGDKVSIEEGKISINDKLLNEPYIEDGLYTEAIYLDAPYRIPEDELFVVGDNRQPGGSIDSRTFGDVPFKNVVGKVCYRVFPLTKIRHFD
ncbi:MAG: signal peptidase I [Peptoniphilaceae bacterium]